MSFALDDETEALAAALSYLDDFPGLQSGALLLDAEPPALGAGDWLGGKALGRPQREAGGDNDEEEEEEGEDPVALLDALTSSSLLDISLGGSAEVAASPLARDAGQSSGEESRQGAAAPSRLQQLRHEMVRDQTQSMRNRMVIPAAKSTATSTALASAAKKAAGKKQLNYNPNRARDERRQELIYLRQKVREMEEQLAEVKTSQPGGGGAAAHRLGQKRPLPATAEPTHDRSSIVRLACTGNVKGSGAADADADATQYFVPKVWEDMCARQLEQRIKAERENIRLKLILEGQIKIAKSMEKLLKKRETLRAMETCGSKRAKRVHLPPTNAHTDAAIYDELNAGVDESYHEVDAVFEANGLDHMETSHRDAQVRDGVDGMYLEVFANKVLPFDMRTTGEAVWQHFKGTEHNATRLARSYYSKKTEDMSTQDTMVERFGLEMHANNTQADFHVKQILRRYVEKDRVVIVWRSRIEPLEFSNKPLSGINFVEKGYVVIKPPSTMSHDFTLLQTCYIITPDLSDKTLNEDAQTGALTEFVLSSTAANITASHEMIENVLLDQARKKQPRI